MGGSAGALEALDAIFPELPADFALPILVVQHLHRSDEGYFARRLAKTTPLPVIEPCDKERIERGRVYIAPANYHMLVEREHTISLSVDELVNWSRPSIDVLFESAARAWGALVVAVILSGASADGAQGMRMVQAAGGLNIAQNPAEAEALLMPRSAIDTGAVDHVLAAEEIGQLLAELGAKDQIRSAMRSTMQDTPGRI